MKTPRTDAERRRLKKAKSYPPDPVSAEFARQLERERDAARDENESMREALQEAHTTLESIAKAKPSEWGEMSDQFKPWAQNRSRHALTKLKPFITDAPPSKP